MAAHRDTETTIQHARRRLVCAGTVQGVGFRPAVYRLATGMGLGGWIRNDGAGVTLEVEGPEETVAAFAEALSGALPPLARVTALREEERAPLGERAFRVLASAAEARAGALVPPDSRVCAACLAEVETPGDRRHGYAFATCTDCGPRYSITESLPYDRPRTTMGCFPLCPACGAEYEDPGDRRFHAEPLCCPECGPRLWLVDGEGRTVASGDAALAAARAALGAGLVVAVKGMGGFQLACRADDDAAVARLRERKGRPTRPFAVMVQDVGAARRLVRLGPEDEALLGSAASPILLAPRLAPPRTEVEPGDAAPTVVESVAPGLTDLGVMLPTTPLHHLLFADGSGAALVMTSGNRTGEPIACGNREAVARLGALSDRLLLHDRDVRRRVDDSVARTTARGPALLRRSRGYVPAPLPLPEAAPRPVLGLGAHLQATTCLAAGDLAFASPHVGDLEGERTRQFLAECHEGLEEFLEARAEVVVTDLHPDYASTRHGERLAASRGARWLKVPHHLAHAAAALAEHGRFPRVAERGAERGIERGVERGATLAAAILLDGTGLGTDGTAWGGEWLVVSGDLRWARVASLAPLPLVGGEAAVREPWRVAVAGLVKARAAGLVPGDAADALAALPLARDVDVARLQKMAWLAGRPGWPLSSGAGRLFEAAGALCGLATVNGYEGEAAIRLEALASAAWSPDLAPFAPLPRLEASGRDVPRLPGAALLARLAAGLRAGKPASRLAAGFHATFSAWACALTEAVLPAEVRVVALGGGCLANRLLREGLARGLEAAGREVLLPREVPPGDGGIAYGQAVLGVLAEARGAEPAETTPETLLRRLKDRI